MANSTPITHSSFEKFLTEHKLMGTRCARCGSLFSPPRPMCPNCHSDEMVWEELDGRGKLAAFTAVFIAPTAMIDAGYGRDKPYIAGVVKLDDGPAISGQIVDVDTGKLDELAIGIELEATFIERNDKTFLGFKPVK